MMRSGGHGSRTWAAGALSACLLALGPSLGGCHSNRHDGSSVAPPTAGPAAPRAAPVRGAAGDDDVRVMLTELVSAQACEQIRGHFQALPASGRPNVMSGLLWIRGCRITNVGTKVKFRLEGNGWQWIDEERKKGGGTFSIRQYVRFGVVATISHVASIWFSLQGDPDVQFTPIGKLDVDAEGAWSSVLGAAASLVATSPGASASENAEEQGLAQFRKRLKEGLSVTVDLCTGTIRSGIGHTARGQMGPAGVGETKDITVELQPGGVMVFGPQAASHGMTVNADVSKGTARLLLVCNAQAEAMAKAFLEGRDVPRGSVLASRDVRGKATLRTGAARCPVSLVTTLPPGTSESATLSWRRPAAEAATSSGGPLIDCPGAGTKGVDPGSPRGGTP
jgi:hypothetical protein